MGADLCVRLVERHALDEAESAPEHGGEGVRPPSPRRAAPIDAVALPGEQRRGRVIDEARLAHPGGTDDTDGPRDALVQHPLCGQANCHGLELATRDRHARHGGGAVLFGFTHRPTSLAPPGRPVQEAPSLGDANVKVVVVWAAVRWLAQCGVRPRDNLRPYTLPLRVIDEPLLERSGNEDGLDACIRDERLDQGPISRVVETQPERRGARRANRQEAVAPYPIAVGVGIVKGDVRIAAVAMRDVSWQIAAVPRGQIADEQHRAWIKPLHALRGAHQQRHQPGSCPSRPVGPSQPEGGALPQLDPVDEHTVRGGGHAAGPSGQRGLGPEPVR